MYAGKWIKKLIINNKNNFFKIFILFQEGKALDADKHSKSKKN